LLYFVRFLDLLDIPWASGTNELRRFRCAASVIGCSIYKFSPEHFELAGAIVFWIYLVPLGSRG